MNLNHLSIFQAVAAQGSVTAGARQLHISQSAVSKQLAEFEHTLGVKLFVRDPRGMRLTEAGRLLQVHANRLIATEAEAELAVEQLKSGEQGRITIGASRTVGAYLLPPVLARFHRRFPGVELLLHVENTATIESRLIAGEIDVGFAEGIIGSKLLDYEMFGNDELVVVCAPGHPITREKPLLPTAISKYPLLLHEPGSGTRAVTERAFSERKIPLTPAMTLASTEAIKNTVATGVGIAILSAFAVRADVSARRLRMVPIKGLTIRRPLYRIQRRGAWVSPALEAFTGMLPP